MILMCLMIPSKHPSLAATFSARAASEAAGNVTADGGPISEESAPAEPSTLEQLDAHLQAAAFAASASGVNLDEFMRQAWSAYVDARPGLREHIADSQLVQQIQELRSAGKVGLA
jgi:hypothetical protein